MVNNNFRFITFGAALFCSILIGLNQANADNYMVRADACDDKQPNDDKDTCKNRAIDQASLIAVKSAGFIQNQDANLDAQALDIVAYQIIDEYMFNVVSTVTFSDDERVCVKVSGNVEIDKSDLIKLIDTYKTTDNQTSVVSIAEQINQTMAVKPHSLDDKKLVYVEDLSFWNGVTTKKYSDLLKDAFSHSDYYYVTENKDIADFVIEPIVSKSSIDKINDTDNKMQMMLNLHVTTNNMSDLSSFDETQNHFILYSNSKDEQEVGDNLIKKLLERAASNICDVIEKSLQQSLEMKIKQAKK